MGPSIRIDGDVDFTNVSLAVADCFNGAVDSHRRRREGGEDERRQGEALQWGRRFASTETQALQADRDAFLIASMGPSIRIDGDASRGAASQ